MQAIAPLSAANEIREQLGSDKRRIGFFFGAGTSMAVGLPGIEKMTLDVEQLLSEPYKTQFLNIKRRLDSETNVEKILDRVRIIRELIGESADAEYDDIAGAESAKALDTAISNAICSLVTVDLDIHKLPHRSFAKWLRSSNYRRDLPVEVFTTNYDLLLERAMEDIEVPFFDGFVGSVAPFFVPECVDADFAKADEAVYPPSSWTRLWKLHGSINWRRIRHVDNVRDKIVRLSGECRTGGELMIFPSRDKYTQSRRLPFLAYQDRLRRFLDTGETLLFVLGYSFSDQHLNEILTQGLQTNQRCAVTVLLFDAINDELVTLSSLHQNLSIYARAGVCLGGKIHPWQEPTEEEIGEKSSSCWNSTDKAFTLAGFSEFCSYLESFMGFGTPSQLFVSQAPTSSPTK